VMHGPRTQRGALLVSVRVKSAGSGLVAWVEEGESEGLGIALTHLWVLVRAGLALSVRVRVEGAGRAEGRG